MKDDIVEKLQAHLSDDIDTECKVVYLLCEVRKLMEKHGPTPLGLRFYCHWALHVDLTHPSTTRPFLTQADAFAGRVLNGAIDLGEDRRMFAEFLMDTFQTELRDFLRHYALPTDLCDDETRWQQFLGQYSGVIQDGGLPVTPRASPCNMFETWFSAVKSNAVWPMRAYLSIRAGASICWTGTRSPLMSRSDR